MPRHCNYRSQWRNEPVCGLAGIVTIKATGAAPSREALLRMVSALVHRGPDEQGIYRDQRAALGHARLSIIDITSGQQPFADPSGAAVVVFNGEIYNFIELRERLTKLGYGFRTRCDTEVVLNAYLAWGTGAFSRMNGQWAIAIWDAVARRLILSRDRNGICPLYFTEQKGQLHFASEVKAIFAANFETPRAIDPIGLDETFTFWSVMPPRSIFKGIRELRPGHYRVYENGCAQEYPFWKPKFPRSSSSDGRFQGSLDDAVDEVRHALEGATARRMTHSDVPVGNYLSGGLDSSLVAAVAQQASGGTLKTFSLRFTDAEYDEAEFQRLMVAAIGSDHHEIEISRDDIAEAFPDVIYHAERPILRAAPAPLFLLSRLARDCGVKVVLTGEGADETFAGYDLFREGKVRRFWGRQPSSSSRHRLLERLYPYLSRSPVQQRAMARQFFGRNLADYAEPGFAHDPRWRATSNLKRLFSSDLRIALSGRDSVSEYIGRLPPEFAQWGALAQDQHIESETLLSGYLLSSQGDRMLMAHSIEGRFPFLDDDIVALANSLPAEYKIRVLDEKHILKRVAREILPNKIVARKKQPFRAPNALCFVGPDAPAYVAEMLSKTAIRNANMFDADAVERLLEKCRAQAAAGSGDVSNSDNMALVGILSSQLLHHQFIARRPDVSQV
ncbi:MAG: asparagine synthase (glutamine-hydrolyzing), partial [Tardiphaga sp.]